MDAGATPSGFYWLLPPSAARGGLAGMPCPTEETLAALPDLGVGLVVSLLESSRGNYRLPAGLRLVRLPVDDGGVPAEIHLSLVARLLYTMVPSLAT